MPIESTERTLDVREIDGPPFDDIVTALESLERGGQLRLIAPFEPVPLYEELDDRGFAHESERARAASGTCVSNTRSTAQTASSTV